MKKPSVIFLMGPTACGKSSLAIELCEVLPCEIISVDSALVYKGMDLGTAKPSVELRARYPHHLIDLCTPDHAYSVADFCRDAQNAIETVLQKNRIPLLVGGTMMYFNALKTGLSELPAADENVRSDLNLRAAKQGWLALHDELKQIDPLSAQKIQPQDAQRISRALEIYQLTGMPLSHWQEQENKKKLAYDICALALMPSERVTLHQHIAQRFDEMIAQGFVEEVKALCQRADVLTSPAMRAVGYRQALPYLNGEYDFATMREKAVAATRQLAKRQITWLRSWEDLIWFVPPCLQSVKTCISDHIE